MENKVIKNDYYQVELVEKNDVTLLKLLNDKEFCHQYFAGEDLSRYTAKYMNKLRNQVEKGIKKRIKRNERIDKLKRIFGDWYASSTDLISVDELDLMVSQDLLKQMEKKLGYLIYLDIITKEDANKRGFDNDYIMMLLENCEKELANRYEKHITYPGQEKRAAENYDNVIKLIK